MVNHVDNLRFYLRAHFHQKISYPQQQIWIRKSSRTANLTSLPNPHHHKISRSTTILLHKEISVLNCLLMCDNNST